MRAKNENYLSRVRIYILKNVYKPVKGKTKRVLKRVLYIIPNEATKSGLVRENRRVITMIRPYSILLDLIIFAKIVKANNT